MRRIPQSQQHQQLQPRALVISRTERDAERDYSDDDYDDDEDDDDNGPEPFDRREGRYPIQATGGNLPPSVVAALQNLRTHGGTSGSAGATNPVEMAHPEELQTFDDDGRRGAHHEAALQFLLYQQQQLHQATALTAMSLRNGRGSRAQLGTSVAAGAAQEYYTEEEHLNRTPSGSSSGAESDDDADHSAGRGRRGRGQGSEIPEALTAAHAYHHNHHHHQHHRRDQTQQQHREVDEDGVEYDDDGTDDTAPENRQRVALVAAAAATAAMDDGGVDEGAVGVDEGNDEPNITAGLAIQDADGQLMEGFTEDYEPTEQEILEYCEWLGMDVKSEKALMWIAREALKAPLPENWKMCYTEEREVYYFNVRTGESIWDHPMDAYFKCLYKEERAKLEAKRRRVRQFPESLPVKPLAEFFGDLSDTCGVGGILLDDEDDEGGDDEGGGEGDGGGPATQRRLSKEAPAWKDIPESLVDPIDFRVFLDPVVLPTSGRTVSRHTIINNLWRDPFSREYCENRRLVPNVDKRMEVDRWLQQMVHAYIQDMRVGTKSGVRRLATILPYLLDREEEATLRAQTLVLSWLNRHIEADRLSAKAEERADEVDANEVSVCDGPALPLTTALPTSGRQSHAQVSNKSSPSTTPRDGAGAHVKRTSVSKQHNSTAKSSTQRSSADAGAGGAFAKKIHSAVHQARSSTSTATVSDGAVVPPPAIANAPSSSSSFSSTAHRRPPAKRLPIILQDLGKDVVDSLVLSLLSMSTSASREALLRLTGHVPSALESTAFRRFAEEILYALRASRKDIWEIVTAAATAEAKEVLEAPPPALYGESSDVGVPAQQQQQQDRRLVAAATLRDNNATQPIHGSITNNAGGGEGSASRNGSPAAALSQQVLRQLLSCHVTSDSERHLALQWIDRLAQYAHVCEQHPLAALDFMSAVHLTLCVAAHMLFLSVSDCKQGASPGAWSSAPLLRLLMRVDGWPAKISAISDKHLSALMEISLHAVDEPRIMVSALFDLTLHGSERCLDVLRRHAAIVRQCVVSVLSVASASASTEGGVSANVSSTSSSPSRASSSDRSRPLLTIGDGPADATILPTGTPSASAVSASTSMPLRRSSSSLSKATSGSGVALSSFSSADLMAAVLVFHELASLSEFSELLPPRVALRIGYNLTPRLARSQWRPKHFYGTVSKMVELVEAHPATAWGVIDRAGLSFFLRELSKKKGLPGDVRSKIEGVEYSDKQLEHSATVTRWGLFALRLLVNRGAEVAAVIAAKQQQQQQQQRNNARRAHQQPANQQTVRPANGATKTPRGSVSSGTAPPPSKQSHPQQTPPDSSRLGYFFENRQGVASGTSTGAMPPERETIPASSLQTQSGGATGTALAAQCPIPVAQQLALVSAKFDDLTRQRASLLSQALMLLITVRLKPRQQPQRGGASSGISTTADTPVKGGSAPSASSANLSASGNSAKFRATPAYHHVQPGASQQNPSSMRSPRHGTAITAAVSVEYSAPPPTSSLPSLRAPRGGGQSMVLAEPTGDVALPHHHHHHHQSGGSGTGFLPPI